MARPPSRHSPRRRRSGPRCRDWQVHPAPDADGRHHPRHRAGPEGMNHCSTRCFRPFRSSPGPPRPCPSGRRHSTPSWWHRRFTGSTPTMRSASSPGSCDPAEGPASSGTPGIGRSTGCTGYGPSWTTSSARRPGASTTTGVIPPSANDVSSDHSTARRSAMSTRARRLGSSTGFEASATSLLCRHLSRTTFWRRSASSSTPIPTPAARRNSGSPYRVDCYWCRRR